MFLIHYLEITLIVFENRAKNECNFPQSSENVNNVNIPKTSQSPKPVYVTGIPTGTFLKGRMRVVLFSCVH